jgi:ankyrin repeat protein
MANYLEEDDNSDAGSVPSLDNLQYDEILDLGYAEDIDKHPFEEKSEETQFREQSWEQQWKEVVKSLMSGETRWDDSVKGQGRLLEEYKKKALTSRDARERTTPTFLHILAKRRDTDDFGNLPSDTLLKIIKYLLEYQDNELVEGGLNKPKDDPILRVAMEFNNTQFIESITECSSEIPGKLDELLNATDHDGMNCLHYAFKEQLPKALGAHQGIKQGSAILPERPNLGTTIKTIHGFVRAAKPETIASRDNYGNTPIHYAMDYNNCRLQLKQYSNIVQYLVLAGDKLLKKNAAQQFNLNNESPYLYYLRTREKRFKLNTGFSVTTSSATTSLERTANLTGKEVKGAIRTKESAIYELKDTKYDHSIGDYQKKLLPPKPGTTEISRTKMAPPPAPENQAAHANPDILAYVDSTLPRPLMRSRTQNFDQAIDSAQPKASSTVISDDGKSRQGKNALDSDTAANKIAEFVKVHYIRTRTDMEAKELLYGKVASGKSTTSQRPRNTFTFLFSKLS